MGSVAERAGAEAELLERSAFIEALEESLAGVGSGGGRLVLVSGEAGIGKTVPPVTIAMRCRRSRPTVSRRGGG